MAEGECQIDQEKDAKSLLSSHATCYRLHDFNIYFMDEDKNVVDSIFNKGGIGSRKTYQVGQCI